MLSRGSVGWPGNWFTHLVMAIELERAPGLELRLCTQDTQVQSLAPHGPKMPPESTLG